MTVHDSAAELWTALLALLGRVLRFCTLASLPSAAKQWQWNLLARGFSDHFPVAVKLKVN